MKDSVSEPQEPAGDHLGFGRYLAQQRELRGLSREEVSRVTKISPSLIAALEEGQIERLPARVFVLNYIRAYAQVIGLSPEEALLRYQEMDQGWVGLALLLVVLGVGTYVALVLSDMLPSPLGAGR
jgi:hypothetical protein